MSGAAPGPPAARGRPSRQGSRPSRRVRRRRLLAFGLAPFCVLAGALAWFFLQAYPLGGEGRQVVIEVHDGEAFGQVVDALASRGVIDSGVAFRIDTLTGAPSVQPGFYALRQNSSFSTVKGVLANGPNALAVQVVPGESTLEMSSALAGVEDQAFAAAFLHLARSGGVPSPYSPRRGASLEGLLGPGLYVLTAGEDPRTLLDQMVARFDHEAQALGLSPSTRRSGLDAYDVVTVASIVEKEGYYPRNMPRTATVVYNRLARGMPLQMDSTVEYALGQDGGPVSSATERVASPYNTYLHTGLTPTPICTMSTTALRAALHPPAGPWLYFTLISSDGTMAFASTFAEQLRNEQLAASRGL